MELIILRRLKDRNVRVLLYILVSGFVLLVFQYALAGAYRRENLRVIETREGISRETNGILFLRYRLSHYERSLAELESTLPQNVESEAAAVEFLATQLRVHGIESVAEEAVREGKDIEIVVSGESVYADMLSFFAGLQQDAPALGVRELLVQALDGDKVSFSAKIIFFQGDVNVRRGAWEHYEEQEKKYIFRGCPASVEGVPIGVRGGNICGDVALQLVLAMPVCRSLRGWCVRV